ncbi:MAG: glycosyltransferase family 2 protein [Moraxella sp.]
MSVNLSLIIVNYHTEKHIISLLSNLSKQNYHIGDFEIILINNTQNTKLAMLTEPFKGKLPFKIISSEYNIGFGRAMNLGASYAKGEHLLITNPDIIIKDRSFLQKLTEHLNNNKNYGAMTCQLLNERGEDKSEFIDFEFHATLGLDTSPRWLSGAFLVVRSFVFKQIGGFDPDFFMYCEDEDLCLRIQRAGLPLVKVNELSLYHIGGVSEPVKSYDFFYRWFRSQILFAYKHFSKEQFQNLLIELEGKSLKKLKTYKSISFLPIQRYKTKQNQWNAMHDIVQKTKKQGAEWLFFKPH